MEAKQPHFLVGVYITRGKTPEENVYKLVCPKQDHSGANEIFFDGAEFKKARQMLGTLFFNYAHQAVDLDSVSMDPLPPAESFSEMARSLWQSAATIGRIIDKGSGPLAEKRKAKK